MEGFCNRCGTDDIEVEKFTCDTCVHLFSGKTDDGRFYRCENNSVMDSFNPVINKETIYRFACNRHEPNKDNL